MRGLTYCTRVVAASVLSLACFHGAFAQDSKPAEGDSKAASAKAAEPLDGREGRNLLLQNFRPKSMLKTKQIAPNRAKFPVVDAHTHFFFRTRHSRE